MNGKELNPLAYTNFFEREIEEEEEDLEKKTEEIIKESLNAIHYRASYQKESDAENYNSNYLYDDY
ncbi:MAG: hypothetical protein HC854_16775 [Flavobacterium sp.]|nr:hypothetical protein [Flavobacterium sp.]